MHRYLLVLALIVSGCGQPVGKPVAGLPPSMPVASQATPPKATPKPAAPGEIPEFPGKPHWNEAVRLLRRIKAERRKPPKDRTMTLDEIEAAMDRHDELIEEAQAAGEMPDDRPRGFQ